MSKNEQRITLQQKSPNPLFIQWLIEWLNYAEQKNSMKRHSLAKAIDSLTKYPLVMYTGRDCSILEGFGPGICQMIDKQLSLHRQKSAHLPIVTEQEHNASVQEVVRKVQVKLRSKRPLIQKSLPDIVKAVASASTIRTPIDGAVPLLDMPPNTFKVVLLVDTQETIG